MPLWLADLAVTAALLITTEIAFRVGRHHRPRHDEVTRSQVTTVQAAALGLLALMLGFTMSMADTRFNNRRMVVLEEANAVGTTYLRTSFMSEPERSKSRELLRQYVEARRAYYRAHPDDVAATTELAQAIHRELWDLAAVVAQAHPDWDVLSTYIEALNEVINFEMSRDIMITARIPGTLRAMLLMIALVAMALTGYATGVTGARSTLTLYVVPVLISVGLALIIDLDRARAGFIGTSDRPMARLQRTLAADRAADLSPGSPTPQWP